MSKRTVLAICGSLRAKSSNRSVILAAKDLVAAEIDVIVFEELDALPHFNPDLDVEPLPAAAGNFRARVRAADALLICSPEYAHGVPGAMKNALDWLVSSGELMGKRVGVINASPASKHAHESLIDTLTVLMAELVEGATIALPLPRNSMTADEIAADASLALSLQQAVRALVSA